MAAIEGGAADCLVVLVSQPGVEINEAMPNGTTPLMRATCLLRPDMVQMLLQAGADSTLRDDEGDTALAYPEENHEEEHEDGFPHERASQEACIHILADAAWSWTVRRAPCWGPRT